MVRASDGGRTAASASNEALRAQIENARQAVQDAYVHARRLVFDRQPWDPLEPAHLNEGQRRALDLWREAEHTLEGLRHAWHRGDHGEAASRPDSNPTIPATSSDEKRRA